LFLRLQSRLVGVTQVVSASNTPQQDLASDAM
jgi:hypothetical protein